MNTASTTTRERVLKIVRSLAEVKPGEGAAELDLESMKMLELLVAIEQEFGIEISEDAPIVRILSSVDSIVAYLDQNQNS